MDRVVIMSVVIVIGPSPAALAQVTFPPADEVAAHRKFSAADKNNSGMLEGAEAGAYKAKMAQIDTNKDGKVSRAESLAGTEAGHIKAEGRN